MKQLNTRLDDELHARLKERAAAENRSVNDLVVDSLRAALDIKLTRAALRERLRAAGKLMTPPRPAHSTDRAAVIATTRGWGTSVSEALEAERRER